MSEPIIESNPNESNGIGLSWVILIAIILLFAIAAVYVAVSIYSGQFTAFFPSEHKDIRGDWGAFGDFFGGVLNPLFSFLALVVLLFTLWQTRLGLGLTQKSLMTTQKTLLVTQSELALTRDELKKSAQALAEQSESLQLQNFENTFFQLLEYNRKTVSEMSKNDQEFLRDVTNSMQSFLSKNVAQTSHSVAFDKKNYASTPSQENLQPKIVRSFFERAFSEVAVDNYSEYLQIMDDLMSFVATCNFDKKELYLSLVRSRISEKEMLFLFYYTEVNSCCSKAKLFKSTDVYAGLLHYKDKIFPKYEREEIFDDSRFN